MDVPGTNWDEIYHFIQASNISDPIYHASNFDDLPVTTIRNQVEAIHRRDKTIANSHSITTARCGLLFAEGDKLTEKDFLPFPELYDLSEHKSKSTISKTTAQIFMNGVNANVIPNKVVSAFGPYISEIAGLLE